MRHGKSYRKLGKETAHRKAMLRNLATSLVEHGRIQTTVPRAKELRSYVEKLVTQGKKKSLHGIRLVASKVYVKSAATKLSGELATRFSDRPGGYTRIVKHGPRKGDAAEICHIEFVDYSAHEGIKRQELREKKAEAKRIEAEAKS